MLKTLENLDNKTNSLTKMLALEQSHFFPFLNLNYMDRMTMANGVETRVPFLDNDLFEFSSRINPKHKHRRGEGKWILKKSMEKYLPKEIIYRSKSGFGAPFRRWIKNELKEMVEDLLSQKNIKNRGIFNAEKVQQLIKNNHEGKIDASYTILNLMCIEIWFRNNII